MLDESTRKNAAIWLEGYAAAIQGMASDISMGISVEKTCEKARAVADQMLEDYVERWLQDPVKLKG